MAIAGFLQLSLCVRDLDRAARFYGEVLGLTIGPVRRLAGPAAGRSLGLAWAEGRSVVAEREGLRIDLFQLDAPRPELPPPSGALHLVFAVDDLDATLHSLRDRGVAIRDESRAHLAPGVASCFVTDPDGLLIELYQQPSEV